MATHTHMAKPLPSLRPAFHLLSHLASHSRHPRSPPTSMPFAPPHPPSSLRLLHRFCSFPSALDPHPSSSSSAPSTIEQSRILCNLVQQPRWNPCSSGDLQHLGFRLSADLVVDLLRAQPHPRQALKVFVWALRQPGYRHDASVRDAVLSLWGCEKLVEAFVDVLGAAGEADFVMTPECYRVLLKGYGCAGMIDAAMKTLGEMQSVGCALDVGYFNSLMYYLVKDGCLKIIHILHEYMTEAGISPDAVTYALRVRGFCVAEQIEEAIKLLFQMLKKGFCPDVSTFLILIEGMCKFGKVNQFYEIVCKMQEAGFPPDDVFYYALIRGLCKNRHVHKAHELVYQMMEKGVEPTRIIYTTLVRGYYRKHQFKAAILLVYNMARKGVLPHVETHNMLIVALLRQGMWIEALRSFNIMKERLLFPHDSTCNLLIEGLCKYRQVRKAYQIWKVLIKVHNPNGDTYCTLLDGLRKAGRLAQAKQVVKDMMEKGCPVTVTAHERLLASLEAAGDTREFQELCSMLKKSGCAPDTFTHVEESCSINQDFERQGSAFFLLASRPFSRTASATICATCLHDRDQARKDANWKVNKKMREA